MSTPAQIDYNALADQARKRSPAPAAKKAGRSGAAIDYNALAARARQSQPSAPAAPDFTSNPRGEGLYRMGSYDFDRGNVSKPEIRVPYSRVREAQAAGYKLHPDEAPRYQKDSSHEGQGPTPYERVANLLTRMTAPMPDTPLRGNAGQQATAALTNVAKLPFNVANRAMRSVAGMPQGIAQTATDLYRGNPAGLESLDPFAMGENAQKGFQEDTGNLGPMAALGNLGGDAAAMYATGKAGPRVVEVATEPMLKVVRDVRNAPESLVRAATNTGEGPVQQLVKRVQLVNEKIDTVNARRTERQKTAQAAADIVHQAEMHRLFQKYQKDVRDAREKFAGNKAAIEQANTEARQSYNQAVGKAVQKNRAVTAAERAKSDQAAQLQAGGSQLIYGLNQLDRALRARAGEMYDAIREHMSGASLPSDTLADAVKAAQEKWIRGSPEKVREFNAMLSTGEASPELTLANQTAQNLGYKDFRSAITNPQMRDTLSRALPPDVWQAAIGQGTRPISWNDLQGFYEETGAKIADGPQPGKADIYKALQQVHGFIGDQMQQLADAHDAGSQHRTARSFYRDYMKTFHDPTGPSGSGSPVAQALLAKDPLTAVEKFSGNAGDRGVANLRQFSDSLANLAQHVRQVAQTKVSSSSGGRASVAEIPLPSIKPVPTEASFPHPPTLPKPETVPLRLRERRTISSPDIVAARRAAAEARASNVQTRGTWVSAWPVFQAMRALWGGHIPSIPTMALESAGTYATTQAVTSLLRHPPLLRFLEQARPEDVPLIPPGLRGELPGLVSQARQRGIKVSPALIIAATAVGMGGNRPSQQSQGGTQ